MPVNVHSLSVQVLIWSKENLFLSERLGKRFNVFWHDIEDCI